MTCDHYFGTTATRNARGKIEIIEKCIHCGSAPMTETTPKAQPGGNQIGKFRSDGPITQKKSAGAIYPKTGTQREKVFAYIKAQGDSGATDEEVQIALGMNPNSERPRRIELVERELVVDSGITRRTKSGQDSIVWMAAL